MIKIQQLKDGDWIRPKRNGWIHECCDCGLQHKVNFKLVKWFKRKVIYMKWERLQTNNNTTKEI